MYYLIAAIRKKENKNAELISMLERKKIMTNTYLYLNLNNFLGRYVSQ